MRNVGITVTVLAALTAQPVHADTLSDAAAGLELFFIQHEIYPVVSCRDDDFQGHRVVYCHRAGNDGTGGLFVVEDVDGQAVAYPINGKAMQFTEGRRAVLMDNSPLPIKPWEGDRIDIPAAIEEALSFW